MEKFTLISYGAISKDFKGIAQLKKQMFKVKNGEIEQHRVDCYKITDTKIFETKFTDLGVEIPREIEIFYPSEKYPSHVDGGGISYFVALESGNFYIDGITYPIVPFVLYAFDDGKLHNTDFCAIMLK
jgi:hypothetical protein